MSKRACRARTAAPVAMEMSRRFMGRLSLTRGARTMRRAQSVLPPVPRPAGRKPTGRAETGGKDACGRPASPGRTLSLRADPRGAPSDMLSDPRLRQGIPFCAGWRRSCRGAIGVRHARLPLRPSPRRGRFSCASAARSLLLRGKQQARGRAARTRTGFAGPPSRRALRAARTRELPTHSVPTR